MAAAQTARGVAAALFVAVLSGCAPQTSAPDTEGGRYEVLFARGGRLFAVRPDGTGERAIAPWLTGCREPQGSPDGRHIAVCAGRFVYIMGRDGADAHAVAGPEAGSGPAFPSWSPDGRTLAFTGADLKPHLIDLDAEMQAANERIIGPASGIHPTTPTFHPRSALLLLVDLVGRDLPELVSVALDGTGYAPLWTEPPPPCDTGWTRRTSYASTGRTVVLENDARGGYDIYLLDLDSGVATCVTEDDTPLEAYDAESWDRNVCARLAPDQRLVFESNRPAGESDARVAQIWIQNGGGSAVPLTTGPEPAHTPGILVAPAL